ncbi:M1 family aminopeptidase [Rufibacter roseus]|uniref:Aminopeptidase N n=1 Tax=Rufibacter roseus TaxID=1567108 RepID=A0ABW2DT28_9BACT|nr:M1 family aminopeptidase [Rufibacter roseus]
MKKIYLFLWCLCLTIPAALAQTPDKGGFTCADAKNRKGHMLLADGITSEPHRALMRQYDINYYKLNLELERNSLDVRGSVTIGATVLANGFVNFAFELHPDMQLQQVLIDGVNSEVIRTGGEAIATLRAAKNNKQKVKVEIFYSGRAPSGASAAIGNGLNTAVAQPWGKQVLWSLSEPFAAYEWFPCKQLLADKADSVEVWVTTDVNNKVGSNGVLQRVTPMPNQKHRFEWKSTYPIAYYLISVAVSQYQEYSFEVPIPGVNQPVFVQNYIYDHPQALATYKAGIDRTADFLQIFSEMFGPYPFYKEKYGHSMAPMGGGMEHQTMTTQQDFGFTLTAHELGHQWWGDEVTNADWSHIWLNEGFASYSELLALERLQPDQRQTWLNRASQFALIPPKGQVFVQDSTNVSRIFYYPLTYMKAGFVLHMLRHTLQEDALFFKVLQEYRKEFRYKVATTRGFQRVAEWVTGRSLSYFFDQWVYGEGYPSFNVTWNQEENNLYLKSVQTTSSAATPFFRTEVEYKITTTLKDTVVLLQHDSPTKQYKFRVSGQVLSITVDPNQWLLENSPPATQDPSLNSYTPEEFSIYPNPTVGSLTLRGGEGLPVQLVVYDMIGRKVFTLVPSGPYNNVSHLRPGSYILKAEFIGKTEIVRFVKL